MTTLPRKEKTLLLMASVFYITACSPEPIESPPINSSLIAIQPTEQFSAFDDAAKARGLSITVSPNDYSVFVDTSVDDDIVGLCSHNPEKPNQIVIGQKLWESSSEIQKEFLFFHQLGHCQLELTHNDEQDSNGNCMSIMRSRNNGCIDNYNEDTRDDYLDELFSN